MELGLSLGEAQKPFSFMQKTIKTNQRLGFCMGLGFESNTTIQQEEEDVEKREETDERDSADPPVQLALLPLLPATRHPSSHHHFPWSAGHESGASGRGFDVNRIPSADEFNDGAPASSPNSVSSMQVDFSIYRGGGKRDRDAAGIEIETERASSRASDEEENGMARKKLRLSKEQSAFLEESFKEHNTLNPKQKLALAKQLNLRPRQVEVWFQNRRARTKLKQTEVDCEYLKRCCETLTEENRRLQKELQELRALKTSNPFYTRLPATTLTMCPSCERVIATSNGADASTITAGFGTPAKHRSFPFSQPHQPAAS